MNSKQLIPSVILSLQKRPFKISIQRKSLRNKVQQIHDPLCGLKITLYKLYDISETPKNFCHLVPVHRTSPHKTIKTPFRF